jgi:hypothetical protein
MVATGILLSRIVGLVRNRVFAHYFGTSDAADAFNAAFRIPNFLQNLFGEGVLSASFIPVYAGLRARGDDREAERVAGAVAALLGLVTAALVLVGVLLTPWLIAVIAPGFDGAKRDATIRLVRILFPGAGLLVLSAWCLGVLNSHRRFFLSYSAPVLWNLAIIVSLVLFGRSRAAYPLAEIAAWGSVVGSLLQLGIQLPTVGRLLEGLRPRLVRGSAQVALVLRNFGPVFVGRGVVQISAYVDTVLASLLPTGAVAGLSYAQVIYTLPVSLFGMSVSAAELPAMASAVGTEVERAAQLRARLANGLRQIAFLVVPSAMAFLALGDVVGVYPGHDRLCVGHPGRLRRGAASLHDGAVVLIGILRHAGHADTASLRRASRGAHDRARLPVRLAAPAGPGRRPPLGRRRAHRVGGARRMDRVPAAQAGAQHTDRRHRSGNPTHRPALGSGRHGRRGGLGRQARPAGGASDRGGPCRPDRLWSGVFSGDRPPRYSRSQGRDAPLSLGGTGVGSGGLNQRHPS